MYVIISPGWWFEVENNRELKITLKWKIRCHMHSKSKGSLLQVERVSFLTTLACLFLMIGTPPFIMLFWYANYRLDGSLSSLGNLILENGFFPVLSMAWGINKFGSFTAWSLIGIFSALQLILMKAVPGKIAYGPETPSGHIPKYKANGIFCYLITLGGFVICSEVLNLFPMPILYDHFGEILGALMVFSILFCIGLYFKGIYAPSTQDSDVTGNPIFDFFWGTELYPRIFGWDVKQFTNCRFGMMAWPLLCLSFAAKQNELYGLSDSMIVAVALQLIYTTKFFLWEMGYMRSLDIMHDRAGYYICWGCLVWLPGIYTSAAFYLVQHPNHLGFPLASALFAIGSASILMNYIADLQRGHVRFTNGKCTIWGKPPKLIEASYTGHNGEQKTNLLLASGLWGIARHFHYVPEIIGALCWSLPALFQNFIPYFYVCFLCVLLFSRAFRDEKRCRQKYGNCWEEYCKMVPYKIIPFIL